MLERESTIETFKKGIPEPAAYNYRDEPPISGKSTLCTCEYLPISGLCFGIRNVRRAVAV